VLNSSDLCPRWTGIHRWPGLKASVKTIEIEEKKEQS
jgi:hypothetical protein